MDEREQSIFEQITALIHQVSGIPVEKMTPADSLIVTLGLDSVEMIDLFMQLETFGVFIETAQITAAFTVGDLVAQVRRSISS